MVDKNYLNELICQLDQQNSNPILKSDNQVMKSLIQLQDQIKSNNFTSATSTLNTLAKSLEKSVYEKLRECLNHFRNNPTDIYPSENEVYTNPPENNEKPADQAKEIGASEPTAPKSVISLSQFNELKNYIFELRKQIINLSTDVTNVSEKANLMGGREERTSTLQLTLESVQKSLDNRTLELIENLQTTNNYTKDLPEKTTNFISSTLSEALDPLYNGSTHKYAVKFKEELLEEIELINKKVRRSAENLATEVVEQAMNKVNNLNNDYVNKVTSKNTNLIIYGLIGGIVTSILTGAFVGKMVGNSVSEATVNYIDTQLTRAQQQHQEEMQNLKRSKK